MKILACIVAFLLTNYTLHLWEKYKVYRASKSCIWNLVRFNEDKNGKYCFEYCILRNDRYYILTVVTTDLFFTGKTIFNTLVIKKIYQNPFYTSDEFSWWLSEFSDEEVDKYTKDPLHWKELTKIATKKSSERIVSYLEKKNDIK